MVWTILLRMRLWLRGIKTNKCIAEGPVKLDLNSEAKITLGRNVFFRGNCELKVRENGLIELGDNVRLDFGVRITVAADYSIKLHEGVDIGFCSLINGGEDITIGSGTALGGHCVIQSSEHIVANNQEISVVEGNYKRGKISIGKSTWLASFVVVRPNVTIGDNTVIGAFSIVNKDIGDAQMAAGIPAAIKKRL